jgi:DNA-binding transcriptional ArsR family regulator
MPVKGGPAAEPALTAGQVLTAEQVGTVEQVLIAVADPIRRRILDVLAADGAAAATATTLAAGLPVSRQAVTKHLAMLDRAGLVAVRRHGREMRYRIRLEPASDTAAWLAGLAAGWERRRAAARPATETAARPDAG